MRPVWWTPAFPVEWVARIRFNHLRVRWSQCADGPRSKPSMLAFVDPETLIPSDHPLRTIKRFAHAALLELSPLFEDVRHRRPGRGSIPPERLLKASLLISLYSVRSERAFCEELTYHLLFAGPGYGCDTFLRNHVQLRMDQLNLWEMES